MESGAGTGAGGPALAGPAVPRRTIPLPRVMAWCGLTAFVLHSVAVVWTWWSGAPGLRGGWLVWLDLPVSLAYLHVMGEGLLWWSFVAGGLQWAVTGALLAVVVGWSARRG